MQSSCKLVLSQNICGMLLQSFCSQASLTLQHVVRRPTTVISMMRNCKYLSRDYIHASQYYNHGSRRIAALSIRYEQMRLVPVTSACKRLHTVQCTG